MNKLLQYINKEKKRYYLSDFAIINPRVELKKNTEHPFLDMSEVHPLQRIPFLIGSKIFKGTGSRFEAGDTLFARITPCLENGKITRVLGVDGAAFGSTEFIILRGKENVSDSSYLYYLAQTDNVRKKAEQNMVGASGRQRVERRAFEKIEIFAPSLKTQKEVAGILSAYDSKIENNNKIIKNLELTAQTIFSEWFVSFRFPGCEKVKMVDSELGEIPEGWFIGKIENVIERLPSQRTYKENSLLNKGSVPVYDQSSKGIIGFTEEEANFKADIDTPVLIFGDHTCRTQIICEPFSLGPNTIPLGEKDGYSPIFSYFLTKNAIAQREYKRHWSELSNIEFIIPSIEVTKKFIDKVKSFINKMMSLEKENTKLKELREQLLVKLI